MEYEFSSSENEEDNEGLLKQALEVKLTDFNPNSVPQDGKKLTVCPQKFLIFISFRL